MTRTGFPAGPMMRVSEPGDIGRVLRFAGRLGHQASLGAAGLRDVADVVRALAISLVLDAHGGWISVRALGCGAGVEVVAFDRPTDDPRRPKPDPWPHLHAQLEQLGALGSAVRVERTPGGGTAVWTRIAEPSDGATGIGGCPVLEVTGLIQAPPGDVHAGWSAVRHGDRLRIVICEATPGGPSAGATEQLLREPHCHLLDRFVRPLGEGAAALVDVDLANRTIRTIGSGTSLTVVVDGETVPVEGTTGWERSVSLLAHTAGIRSDADGFAVSAPAALGVATLMREHREPTATACVVAARIEAPS
ncbi:MAG TPA: hypothetical protein VJ872_04960 [Nocardioides sp.]|nr:hypothetical protein [Nocardioides sp.]